MLSTHLQLTVSSQDWTNIGTIWTSKADKSLLVHQLSSSKFKKEGCQYSFVTYLSFDASCLHCFLIPFPVIIVCQSSVKC